MWNKSVTELFSSKALYSFAFFAAPADPYEESRFEAFRIGFTLQSEVGGIVTWVVLSRWEEQ